MATGKCINHDHRDAVSRCRQCHKPLCGDCQLVTEEGIFCGEDCYTKGKAFHKRVTISESERQQGKRVPRAIRRLLILAIVVLIVIAVLRFVLGVESIADFLDLISELRYKFLSR